MRHRTLTQQEQNVRSYDNSEEQDATNKKRKQTQPITAHTHTSETLNTKSARACATESMAPKTKNTAATNTESQQFTERKKAHNTHKNLSETTQTKQTCADSAKQLQHNQNQTAATSVRHYKDAKRTKSLLQNIGR